MCWELDGNTKLKSKDGHYGKDSSIGSNAVQLQTENSRPKRSMSANALFAAPIAEGSPNQAISGPREDRKIHGFATDYPTSH